MDLKSGYPWWLLKNGLMYDYAKLENDTQTEVLIVGSGITGALVAHFLCEAGIKCVIADKRTAGTGSTIASTAQLQYEIDTFLFELIDKVGLEHAVKAYFLCLESVYTLQEIVAKLKIDCGFEMRPSIYYASDKKGQKDLEKEFTMRRQHGLPVTYLDAKELKNDYGIDQRAALYNDHSAQVDAYKFSQEILQYHIKHSGLRVFDKTEVVKIKRHAKGIDALTQEGATISARKLVVAPGFESESFLKQKVMNLNSTYVVITEPIDKKLFWKERCLIWETARPYFYIRTTTDNRIIMGGEDEPFSNPVLRDALLEKKVQKLLKNFKSLFPGIEVIPDYYWCGTFGETQDGLPYIGEYPGQENTYYALGYGGNGITFSVIAAEIIRDLYLGKPSGKEKIFAFKR